MYNALHMYMCRYVENLEKSQDERIIFIFERMY